MILGTEIWPCQPLGLHDPFSENQAEKTNCVGKQGQEQGQGQNPCRIQSNDRFIQQHSQYINQHQGKQPADQTNQETDGENALFPEIKKERISHDIRRFIEDQVSRKHSGTEMCHPFRKRHLLSSAVQADERENEKSQSCD